eukprot:1361935-Alexandrium_andersonii.AAC.1
MPVPASAAACTGLSAQGSSLQRRATQGSGNAAWPARNPSGLRAGLGVRGSGSAVLPASDLR